MANPPTRATPKPPAPAAKAYDLDALRTAVDDAAKASGPLWASYILALFYFLVAAGGVTHKDMFLERPVKLPFLGVDLPIVGFFIVTPPVFVLLHAYVLLTFAVMARKVEAFDGALVQQIGNAERRQAMRRQLSSSLFVQSLAGPRELRQGIVGLLLRAVAVVSLMAGPVVLLLFLQLQFLPYHSHGATWSARLSLCADLVFLWLLWQRLQLPPLPIAGRGRWRYVGKLPGYLARALCRAGTVAALWLAFCIGTFPGEALDDLGRGGWMRETLIDGRAFWPTEYGPRINMMKGLELPANDPMAGVDMVRHRPTTWFTNRLIVMNFDIAEDDRFNSQEKYDLHAVTFDLRAHDLRRAVLSNSDLRKADLTGAMLTQAVLDGANLNHSKLDGAQMQGASLMDARMQGASLIRSEMQGALLDGAQMQGASFDGAQMQGASLNGAKI